MTSNEPGPSTSSEKEDSIFVEYDNKSEQLPAQQKVNKSSNFKSPLPVLPRRTFHFEYHNKEFDLSSLFDERKVNQRTLLDDKIIDFYFNMFITKARIGDDETARSSVKFYDTYFYECLKTKFDAKIKKPPKRSELAQLHYKMFKKPDEDVSKKDLLVIPVHIKNPRHWILVMIHNTKGAIRTEKKENERDSNQNNLLSNLTGSPVFDIQDQGQCRILIMDSLMHSVKLNDILKKHREDVASTLQLWLQMTVAFLGKELMINRTRVVLCRNLPKQNNSFDCGLFLLTYAEYFIYWNTDWMDWPTEDLVELEVDENVETSMKEEQIRVQLQNLLEYMASEKRIDK